MWTHLTSLIEAEDGGTVAEFSLFMGMLVIAGAGFFCFTAGQFREVFQSSYSMK
ncbi:MAG: hypothetical protein JWM80_6411 [Cyanobacteria bacterium RYN_339]|nr:hypothetical protein [Cyanobacteria bacterium RYN_339]